MDNWSNIWHKRGSSGNQLLDFLDRISTKTNIREITDNSIGFMDSSNKRLDDASPDIATDFLLNLGNVLRQNSVLVK